MDSSDLISPDPRAEAVYLEYLERLEAQPELSLEGFLARRLPEGELAGVVRGMHAAWSWFDRARHPETGAPPELPEPYLLEDEIARGGMGVVYCIWDRRLRRRLAMKVSRFVLADPGDAGSPGRLAAARFVEEAQVTAQLDHPGVVPVHDMGVDSSGRHYFTMRRVEGRTLDEVFELARAGREGWTLPRALGVLVQVCETIAFAHSRQVVHRDLKPTNVMVGRFGETYVMDWGLAKVLGSEAAPEGIESDRLELGRSAQGARSELATGAGAVIGTPAYMAPEQAAGETGVVGTPADVYALGAILYHLLTGAPPYDERPAGMSVLDAVRGGPPRPVGRRVPVELISICERAMRRDPARRYARVEDLRDDLRAFLETRVVSAHRTGALVELRKWVERNRGLAAAFAVILLLAVGALALQVEKSRRLAEANLEIQAAEKEARESLAEARFEGYVANLTAAAKALDLGDAAVARRSLAACPPEERGFEWRHLSARLDASLWSLELGGNLFRVDIDLRTGRILCLRLDGPEWRLLVVDGEGHERAVPGEPTASAAVWLRDGDIAVGSRSGWLARVEPGTGAQQVALPAGAGVLDLALDPGGNRLAVGRMDGSVEVRDAGSLELLASFATGHERSHRLAWHPAGELLASSAGAGWLVVWDVERGVEVMSIDASSDLGPLPAEAAPLVFADTGALVFFGRTDGSIGAWGLDGRLAYVLAGHQGSVTDLLAGVVPGTLVSSALDHSLAVWDLGTRRLRDRMPGHRGRPFDLAPGPEPASVTSVGEDGTVRTWAAGGARRLEVLEGHERAVFTVRPTGDGRSLVSGGRDGTLRLWDVATRRCRRSWSFGPAAHLRAALGPDPGLALVSDGMVELGVLSLDAEEPGLSLGERPYHNHHPVVGPDGRLAAAHVAQLTRLVLYELATGAELGALEGRFSSWPSFTPAGDRILDGTPDGRVLVVAVPSMQVERELVGHAAPLRATAVAPDGSLWASSSTDGVVKLWEPATGRWLRDLEGHEISVTSMAFSPDGTRLVTGCYDKTLRLWDLERGKSVLTLTGHTAPVMDVAFAPDGSWIASASQDATVRIWDTRSARELLPRVLAAERTGSSDGPAGPRAGD